MGGGSSSLPKVPPRSNLSGEEIVGSSWFYVWSESLSTKFISISRFLFLLF